MSATLDAALFSGYFGGAPTLTIPGRTFAVTPLYLEDAIELTGHVVKSGAPWAARKGGGKGGGKGRRGKGGGGDDDDDLRDDKGFDAMRRAYPRHAPATAQALAALDEDAINYELVVDCVAAVVSGGDAALERLAKRLHPDGGDGAAKAPAEEEEERRIDVTDGAAYTQSEFVEFYGGLVEWNMAYRAPRAEAAPPVLEAAAAAAPPASAARRPRRRRTAAAGCGGGGGGGGAVLIFLPGLKEIETTLTMLADRDEFSGPIQQRWLLPLHSTLSPEEQMTVFARPPPGITKVVAATNIAETSITIDDVSYVVDTCKLKENRFDPQRRLETLVEDFGSRANLKQRRGRAGRVRCGYAIHLVTASRFEELPAQQTPELQRTPLEHVVLRAKKLWPHRAATAVLADLPEPPTASAIKSASNVLVSLGALERVAARAAAGGAGDRRGGGGEAGAGGTRAPRSGASTSPTAARTRTTSSLSFIRATPNGRWRRPRRRPPSTRATAAASAVAARMVARAVRVTMTTTARRLPRS